LGEISHYDYKKLEIEDSHYFSVNSPKNAPQMKKLPKLRNHNFFKKCMTFLVKGEGDIVVDNIYIYINNFFLHFEFGAL
jgi:hypothetical protein